MQMTNGAGWVLYQTMEMNHKEPGRSHSVRNNYVLLGFLASDKVLKGILPKGVKEGAGYSEWLNVNEEWQKEAKALAPSSDEALPMYAAHSYGPPQQGSQRQRPFKRPYNGGAYSNSDQARSVPRYDDAPRGSQQPQQPQQQRSGFTTGASSYRRR